MSKELVKPVEIFTEEDLAVLDKLASNFEGLKLTNVSALIASHRELLSTNATLSFENMKLKEAKKLYEKALGFIADATYEGPAEALKWRDIANDALEAFDHE